MKTTRQQAIAELKGMIKHISDGYCCHLAHGGKADSQVETELDALHFAVNALEKQIPKKPIATDEQHIRYSMSYVCPLCGKHFSGTGIASYCYHCGQALDWNDNFEKGR